MARVALGVVFLVMLVPLLLLPLASTQATYHIRPTSDSPCPHEDCLTLSQYTSQNRSYSNSDNLTLVFLPGEHVLNTSIVFLWPLYDSVTLLGNDSSLPNITSKIVCNECSAFALIHVFKVEIRALGFESCGQNTSEWTASPQDLFGLLEITGNVVPTVFALFVPHFHLTSCCMDSNYLPLYVYESAVHSQNCEFTNNTGAYGGAVLAYSSTVEFTGQTLFQDNIATEEGGAMSISFGDLLIKECAVFLNNKAKLFGGGIASYYSSVRFDYNTSSSSADIVNTSGDRLCELGNPNIQFDTNVADLGGALCVFNTSIVIAVKTTFHGNRAINSGGGVYAQASKLTFRKLTTFADNQLTFGEEPLLDSRSTVGYSYRFYQNSAFFGGAISISYSFLMLSENCIFANNSGEFYGAGIYVSNSTLQFYSKSVFRHNHAHYGGAICIFDSFLLLSENCIFANNSGEFKGAGIYVFNSTLQFYAKSVFRHNHAYYGSGITGDSDSRVYFFDKPTLQDNIARYGGGGMGMADNSTVHFEGITVFTGNFAEWFGGGIFLELSTLVLRNMTTFSRNTAQASGGGMYLSGGSLNISGLGIYTDNTAGSGGMASIADGAVVTITGEQHFERNLAMFGGGGIFLELSTLVLRNMTTFSRNTAQESGGGMYLRGGSLSISGLGVYTDNTAGFSGGMASIAYGAVVTITGEQHFERNLATFGGAVALEKDSKLNSHASEYHQHNVIAFSRNQAVNGGAIFSGSGSGFTLNGTHQFVDNKARYVGFGGYGGAIYALQTRLLLSGWQKYTNNSARYGGAIAVNRYSETRNLLTLSSSSIVFYKNYANKSGGAIFVEEDVVTHCGFTFSHAMERLCFIQNFDSSVDIHTYVIFESNYAKEGGDKVYGGELENCIVSNSSGSVSDSSGIELLAALAHEPVQNVTSGLSSISSGPYKVCICDPNTLIPDCSQHVINKRVILDRESPSP